MRNETDKNKSVFWKESLCRAHWYEDYVKKQIEIALRWKEN